MRDLAAKQSIPLNANSRRSPAQALGVNVVDGDVAAGIRPRGTEPFGIQAQPRVTGRRRGRVRDDNSRTWPALLLRWGKSGISVHANDTVARDDQEESAPRADT